MKKFFTFLSLVSLLLLSACSLRNTGVKDSNEPITYKLGIITPLSGDASAYGQEMERIFNYEIKKINEKTLKQGVQFELVYEDGKCSGADAVTAFQKLTDIDGVKVVLGGLCSSETLAVSPLATSKEIVLLSAGSSTPDIENQGNYVFSLSYRDDLVGQSIAKELNNFTKIAVITEQNDYNIGLRKVVLDHLNANTKVVADETFEKGGNDFRNILEKVSKAKPEVLFLNPNPGTTAENLIKQIAENKDLSDAQIVSQGAYIPEPSHEAAKETLEGAILIDAPQMTSPELAAEMKAIVTSNGTLDTLGTYYSASSIDAINILTDMMVKYKNNAPSIKNALRTDTFKGFLGTIYFGDQNFFQNIPTGRYIITNGKSVLQK